MFRSVSILPLLLLCGCELAEPAGVMGNFEGSYTDNLRVFINDELVAEVVPGEENSIEVDGEIIRIAALCGDEETECPSESYWREVAVDQPQGEQSQLLNFVNLDPERGTPGQRMGGRMADDRSFTMLSGLDVGGNELCAAIAVGTVTGRFTADGQRVEEGIVAVSWSGGCNIGDGVGLSLRLETDYTAVRVGDYDLGGIGAEPPIDEEGEPVE